MLLQYMNFESSLVEEFHGVTFSCEPQILGWKVRNCHEAIHPVGKHNLKMKSRLTAAYQ